MVKSNRRKVCVLLTAVLLLGTTPARADDSDATASYSADLCDRAIVNGARRGGVPAQVLHAISLTETGREQNGRLRPWPWAINREGKSYWFNSREEALAFARQSLAEGRRSFDVGCVQINYRWHGHAFPSVEDMFNPEWTATYAAQFLRTLYEERGSWSEAAGAYHSLTPELAQIYRKRFDGLMASIDPDALSGAAGRIATVTPHVSLKGRMTRAERREAQRLAWEQRRQMAGPPPEPGSGGVAGQMFLPATGILLNHGTPLLRQGQPMLTVPPGKLF